jgi:hypothetical protein
MNALTSSALSVSHLQSLAPAIFAESAHESRSQRYGYIPTVNILNELNALGWYAASAMQSKSRKPGSENHTKHLIRLRHHNLPGTAEAIPEVLLENSHNGTSGYKVMAGLFRMLCFNGLAVASSTIQSISIPHTLHAATKVIEGTYSVLDQTAKLSNVVEQWRKIPLTLPQATEFAERAHALRFTERNPETGQLKTTVTPDRLLVPRRLDDTPQTLWHTFNTVQENVVAGGLDDPRQSYTASGRVKWRQLKTRPVKSIDLDLKLNKGLWAIAEQFAAAA